MTEPSLNASAPAPAPTPAPMVPDVKAPRGRLPEWVWWAGGFALLAGFGAFAYVAKSRQPPPAPQKIITTSEIPDDFFKGPELPAKPAEKAPEPAKVEAKPAPQPVAQAPVKITAAQLFTASPVQVAPPAPHPAEAINEARRKGGVAKVAKAGRMVDAVEWVNSEEDFPDEKKTIASFPVDLSRVVTADRFIPALLVNAINSELPGKVVAVIESNVYAAHGSNILVPAGSRAVGRYKALAKPGDERIMVIWERIITPELPNGGSINIHVGDAEMTDAMGRSGLTGEVDNRFMDRYGMALLVSSVSAAASYSVPVTNQGQAVIVQTYGSNIASLSSQILEKNINLKPKITLDAGQRILISPNHDLWFKKPERNEGEVVALNSAAQRKGGKQ